MNVEKFVTAVLVKCLHIFRFAEHKMHIFFREAAERTCIRFFCIVEEREFSFEDKVEQRLRGEGGEGELCFERGVERI